MHGVHHSSFLDLKLGVAYVIPDGRAERLAKREPKLVTREGLAEYLRQKIVNLVCRALGGYC